MMVSDDVQVGQLVAVVGHRCSEGDECNATFTGAPFRVVQVSLPFAVLEDCSDGSRCPSPKTAAPHSSGWPTPRPIYGVCSKAYSISSRVCAPGWPRPVIRRKVALPPATMRVVCEASSSKKALRLGVN